MKKIIALALVVVMLFTLASCGISRKSDKLKEKLEKKYGDDVSVTVADKELSIGIIAAMFDLDADDIDCILSISLDDEGEGFVIYCKDAKAAKEVKNDCKDYVDDNDLKDEDILVKKSGKTIFVGEKDLWKKIKGV